MIATNEPLLELPTFQAAGMSEMGTLQHSQSRAPGANA
jgi:hypothetical protein